MKMFALPAAILGLALSGPTSAFALCGDVTGDGKRTPTDALAVLRSSVGQTVNLQCAESGPSRVRYYNDFSCSEGSSVSELTFNGFTFLADAGETSEFQTVDRLDISDIEIDLCGTTYTIDGPLALPRNRSIEAFMVKADPDIYTFADDPVFFVLFDLGEPVETIAGEPAGEEPRELAVAAGHGS